MTPHESPRPRRGGPGEVLAQACPLQSTTAIEPALPSSGEASTRAPWAGDRRWRHRSGFEVIGQLPRFAPEQIAASLNVFRMPASAALRSEDPILRAFAQALPAEWALCEVIIRSKLAWLRPGWLPGPARWHADQSTMRVDGEEDYRAEPDRGRHIVGAVVGGCSLTRFVTDDVEVPDVPGDRPVRALVTHGLEARARAGALRTTDVGEGQVFRFGYADFHRAMPATHTGWRVIFRASVRRADQPVGPDDTAWHTALNAYEPPDAEAMALFAPYL
jgi:hypothetical protein